MRANTMTVVMLEPGKEACVAQIGTSLEAMQGVVGGYIQAIYPFEDRVAIVCDEEGKLKGLPLCRALYTEQEARRGMYDIISGTAFICGLTVDDFCSLTQEQQERYIALFRHPEAFVRIDRQIIAFPI